MSDSELCLAFSMVPSVGPKTFLKLLKHFGSINKAWEELSSNHVKEKIISEKQYESFINFKNTSNLESCFEKLQKAKVNIVGYTDENYPSCLKNLISPPIILYCKGNLDLLNTQRSVGVVGARKITSYGKEVTEKIVGELVLNNFTVVSGLAFGVDAVAHKKTLDNNGLTIAVLGCGVDCCTPRENESLYEQILDGNGLIVSEYFLGTMPTAGTFPARNRIIAGLSLGVLITEAAEDSGSLITTEEAKKLGRPVFAVPGSINSQMSKGALKLLKDGASIVTSAEDILEKLKVKSQNLKDKTLSKNLKLNTKEKIVFELLENESLPLDIIGKEAKIPMVELMVLISSLEMKGVVENRNGEIVLRNQ